MKKNGLIPLIVFSIILFAEKTHSKWIVKPSNLRDNTNTNTSAKTTAEDNLNIDIFATTTTTNSDENLIAHYPFSGNANDASGNGNNAETTNATLATDRFGNIDAAYQFNGINNAIVFNDISAIKHSDFNVSFWVFSNIKNKEQRLIDKTDITPNRSLYIEFLNNGKVSAACGYSSNYITIESTNTYNDGLWHFISFNYKIQDTKNLIQLFIDKELVASREISYKMYDNSLPFRIGNDGGSRNYNGKLDDIRIYNKALTETEILELYEENEWQMSQENKLLAQYSFTGNANDMSGNGNNGAVNGAKLTLDRFKKSNSAYEFDGIDDYIDIGNKVKPEFPASISTWIYLNELGNFYIFRNDKSDGCSYRHGFTIECNEAGMINASVLSGFATRRTRYGKLTAANSLKTGKWYHLYVAFRDHKEIDIYLNGILQDSEYNDGTGNRMTYSQDGNGAISGRFACSKQSYMFNGKIDDLQVYSGILSDSELKAIYHKDGWPKIDDDNSNTPPSNILLSQNQLLVPLLKNDIIGTLTSSDPDQTDGFKYSFANGDSSAWNKAFYISNKNLYANTDT